MKLRTEKPGPGDDAASEHGARDQRIKDLLMEALERAPAERESFIAAAEEDPLIRSELMGLIDSHQRAGAFMENPSIGPETAQAGSDRASDEAGSMIGRYQLLQLIGEGGFGRVYRAEQREPVVRTVALKIIKLGMDTRQVIARFEAERQALAMMDHPGIARVLDAGADARGRPYFAMELVQGVPITAYCDQHRLSIEQRLDLFSQVCAAVHHAHMKGIIHRDLKPGNILVADDSTDPADRLKPVCPSARPKVIDFGIAKAISGRLTDRTIVTEMRQLIGTPEYMSPEQAEHDAADVDTRADVYSLGVVLYELLTGTTPLDVARLRSASFGDMQRMIREDEPLKPSTRLSSLDAIQEVATHRAIEPRRLASQLAGDLDWIALKAMEKNRDRRYASPSELAEDIRRHLAHEPVQAGPPSRLYRLRKFVRRNRRGVVATTLMALMAAVGAVVVAASMLHASDAADQTAQINQFMTNMLTSVDPDRGKGADLRLVEVLGEASASASGWFAGHPELEAQVREVLGQTYNKLSLFPQCVAEFRQALALSESALGPDDENTLRRCSLYVGAMLNAGQTIDLEPALIGLADRVERALGRTHDVWFAVKNSEAQELSRRRQYAQAIEALEDLLHQAKAAGVREETQIAIMRGLAYALWRQTEYAKGPARKELAARFETAARELVEHSSRLLGPEAVLTLHDQTLLGRALLEGGEFQAAADLCAALLRTPDARLGACHIVRKSARSILSSSLLRLGRTEEAADITLQAIECERLEAPVVLVSHLNDALPILDRGGRWAEGERCARELEQALRDMGGGHGAMVMDSEIAVARFVSLQGRLDEADELFASLLAREGEISDDRYSRARLHRSYGAHLAKKALYEEAERHLQRASEALGDPRKGTRDMVPDDIIIEFIALYQTWDKPEKVAEYQRLQYEALNPLEWTQAADPQPSKPIGGTR